MSLNGINISSTKYRILNVVLILAGTFVVVAAIMALAWYVFYDAEVYMSCKEVEGYATEKLELRHGKFTYWSISDAQSIRTPIQYPLTGTYSIEGSIITLHNENLGKNSVRFIDRINGVPILWRKVGLELWQEDGRIHPYSVLIRANRGLIPYALCSRPSIKLISLQSR
jgi:hypothetical protein